MGDLYDLQQKGGWEDLSILQRIYVEMEQPKGGRPSVMDRWEQGNRKATRGGSGRMVQVVAQPAPIQVGGLGKRAPQKRLRKAR